MIQLYQFANSVCCQKVRLVLREKRLTWETIEIDLTRNGQHDPAYLALNPSGVVPTLVDDGQPVIESTLICEYLEETHPAHRLLPERPIARAMARSWSKLVDEGLHDGIAEISFSARRDRLDNMTEDERQAFFNNVGDPRRRDRFTATYELGVRSPFLLYAVAAYSHMFGRLENALRGSGPWIMGDQLTLADIALAPYVARLEFLGLLNLWIHDKPNVRAWKDRLETWPTYQAEIVVPMKPELERMASAGARFRPELAAVVERAG